MSRVRINEHLVVVPEAIAAVRLDVTPEHEAGVTFTRDMGTYTMPCRHVLEVLPIMGSSWVHLYEWVGCEEEATTAFATIEAALLGVQ